MICPNCQTIVECPSCKPTARKMKEGCICDPVSWPCLDDEIPEVCLHFEPGVEWPYCITCEHLAGCHKGAK